VGANTFLQELQTVLRAHPTGLSEYDLIKILEAEQVSGFENGCLKNVLSVFQTHFLLFNALYQLADQLVAQGEERLIIHTLSIQLLPIADASSQALGEIDAMRDYYLDMRNLQNTDAADVENLLKQFWTRFLSNDERRDALAVLDLRDPVDWRKIKQRHRELSMLHHPDRGGDEQQLQEINAAMTILARTQTKSD